MTAPQPHLETVDPRQDDDRRAAVEAPLFLAPPHVGKPGDDAADAHRPAVLDTPPVMRFSAGG